MAYVTSNLDSACRAMDSKFGIRRFWRTGARNLPLDGDGEITIDVALAWVGTTMVEIIEPLGGDVAIYREWLAGWDSGLRFHHIGVRLYCEEEWRDAIDQCGRQGQKILFSITGAASKIFYVDTRDAIGHYLEYLFYFDIPNSSLPRIPQNVPNFEGAY
jgi:hypothetical protein